MKNYDLVNGRPDESWKGGGISPFHLHSWKALEEEEDSWICSAFQFFIDDVTHKKNHGDKEASDKLLNSCFFVLPIVEDFKLTLILKNTILVS